MLDATTKDTALKSLSQYLNVEPSYLSQTFREIQIPEANDPAEYLLSYVENKFGKIQQLPEGVWFHGSRVQSPKSFWESGIRTKSEMHDSVYEFLSVLAHDIPCDGEYPHSISTNAKESLGFLDEGPFASLFREQCISPGRGPHNYTHVPELVEDLAGQLCGSNYSRLVSKFQDSTRPCIVHFKITMSSHHLSKFLYFVFLTCSGFSTGEASQVVHCFCNLKGKPVEPGRIIKIETL